MLYPDPELTNEGVEQTKQVADLLQSNISARWGSEPYTLASSQLIRAAETAFYMLAKSTNKPINIFPYIGEKGITYDNYAIEKHEQYKFMSKRNPEIVHALSKGRDLRDSQNMYTKSNWDKFIVWATENPEQFEHGSDGHYRAVIFTHSKLIKSAFPLPGDEYMGNNDGLHTIINTEKLVAKPRFEYWPMSHKLGTRKIDADNDGCMLSTGVPTRKNSSVHENRALMGHFGGVRKTRKTTRRKT
jgi:broad specificity phosphatase PhoE